MVMLIRLTKLSGFSLPSSQRQRENHLSLRPLRLAVNAGFS